MRKIVFIVFLMLSVGYAQNNEVLYDFAELPQTLILNPGAEVSNNFYVGFPLLSQVAVQGGFSAFSYYDIFASNGVDINTKIDDAVQKFGNAEFIEVNQKLEALSGGFKLNNTIYLSFGYYQEFNSLIKIPKSLVDLAYYGNSDINHNYSVNKLAARAELLGVFHAGISKKINEKWQVGARGKIYSSAINVSSKRNAGALKTTYGTDNIYKQQLNNVDLLMQTSGVFLEDEDGNIDVEAADFVKKMLLGGNLGLGLDLGFTHNYKEQWTVSGSVLDLGFVYNTQNVKSYQVKGDFEVEGFDLEFDNSNAADYWNDLKDRFEKEVVLDTLYTKYITLRPLKFYGAIHYSFGKEYDNCRFETRPGLFSNKVGVQLYSTLGQVHSNLALTLFFEHWFNKHFQAKVTYTADSYTFANLGLGISTQLGPVNLYLLADNLQYLSNLYAAKSANVQVGLNFIFYNNN
ncbi:hypothetical protein EC396_02325 [Lutibacter sp. HS1-25]|uniref:DUF5723 family protein n=1 Tax=Lutibacter sp. HS1-25 TaxID=2485000 RepID=UPI001012C12E|nr:DUF5723 family protein [Lutibacter sp. HS1-25]RXP63282.1 hypothetical protein EC396_02325 [Lutibacter sp. HS1-25]